MMQRIAPLLLIALAIGAAACNQEAAEASHTERTKAHWSYEGETSPEHWAETEANSDCDGDHQSPINIIDKDAEIKPGAFPQLSIQYHPQTILHQVTNNGHTVKYDFEAGDSIQLDEATFYLKQLHFHEPSEHTINGIRYPIEIHLVHANNEGDYTVLSILGAEGEESELFEFFESYLPLEKGATKAIDKSVDLTSILPAEKDHYYSYAGSLTTPPCTERVNWIIYKEPVVLSVEEVNKLKQNMPLNNYRPTQPLNDRVVLKNF